MLGPVQVFHEGQRVPLGGPQPEKVLAALLLAEGQVVALDDLVDALWDAAPPPTATHQVHKLIAGLRRRIRARSRPTARVTGSAWTARPWTRRPSPGSPASRRSRA